MSADELDIDVRVRQGEFVLELQTQIALEGVTGLFGPSGSGKTTLLRLIAGLDRPDRGKLVFAGETWFESQLKLFRRPYERNVGLVFQGGDIFPHLSVQKQLRYADTRAPRREGDYDFQDIVSALDLDPLLAHMPNQLSGGERQRVALAMAVLTRPRLLLLDEPLSGLDRERKRQILPYLLMLHRTFGIPQLYVSHDVTEMSWISDRVLALKAGKAVAYGDAVSVLNQVGFSDHSGSVTATIVTGTVMKTGSPNSLAEIEVCGHTLYVPSDRASGPGDATRLIIQARDVALSSGRPEGLSIQNIIEGQISSIRPDPDSPYVHVGIDIGGTTIAAQITQSSASQMKLAVGSNVFALIKAVQLAS